MFSHSLKLACSLLVFSVFNSVNAQAVSTATRNGIISAAGGLGPTQSVSYLIDGVPLASVTTSLAVATSTRLSTSESGKGSSKGQHGLTTPVILGITLAVLVAVIGIIVAVYLIHNRRRKESVARAKRKSIMDKEFAGDLKADLHGAEMDKPIDATTGATTIGYFDIAKPLPAVVNEVEDDRLSRSSTIIGDAAEVAQINRKATKRQKKQKAARAAVRERNHALQILITNEDNRTSVVPPSPLESDPATPVNAEFHPQAVDADSNPQGSCSDGDGDPFAKRPSKI